MDCGLGNKHQQSTYSILSMYIHGGGFVAGSERRGGVQGPQEPMDGVCRLLVGP
jgi:hypothetical protein